MKIKKISLGSLANNCYFLIKNNDLIIIDPGFDGSFLSEEILNNKLNLQAILLTHGHFDHLGGLLPLYLNFSIPILLHQSDLSLYQKANKNCLYFTNFDLGPLPPINALTLFSIKKNLTIIKNQPDDIVKKIMTNFDQFKIKIIETPGHTQGSCCFYLPKEKSIFTGDTLFKNAIGRTDFSYSNKTQMKKSLNKLFKLKNNISVMPGHGEETNIGQERTSQNYDKI